jgi:hypothetical protein
MAFLHWLKKLEADESLKIVEIRGVGYKLIVNG